MSTRERRDAIDVARVLALALVVFGHLMLAVVDRPDGEIRGANLLALYPGWASLTAAAPMPVFFAAGGYANATASLADSARRLRVLAGLGAVVVTAWSAGVAVTVLVTGDAGIVGQGARIATQPLWFVAAYAVFAASGRPLARLAGHHPVWSIGGCISSLALLDLTRFGLDGPGWIGWFGFLLAWVVPWLAGGWWRFQVDHGGLEERRAGAGLTVAAIAVALVLVHGFGYSSALIDVVPGARSNTTPPTLYTAVAGLAQVGVLMLIARRLDRLGRRFRRFWNRAGEAAVAVYLWHLTALAICGAAVAAGAPAPERLTSTWWLTRPVWWSAVLGVALGLVLATDWVRRRLRSPAPAPPVTAGRRSRQILGVVTLSAAGAAVGLEGPRSLPLAAAWSALFVSAWWLLRDPPSQGRIPRVFAPESTAASRFWGEDAGGGRREGRAAGSIEKGR